MTNANAVLNQYEINYLELSFGERKERHQPVITQRLIKYGLRTVAKTILARIENKASAYHDRSALTRLEVNLFFFISI
jgi:hypothetical protein